MSGCSPEQSHEAARFFEGPLAGMPEGLAAWRLALSKCTHPGLGWFQSVEAFVVAKKVAPACRLLCSFSGDPSRLLVLLVQNITTHHSHGPGRHLTNVLTVGISDSAAAAQPFILVIRYRNPCGQISLLPRCPLGRSWTFETRETLSTGLSVTTPPYSTAEHCCCL